ncbi:4-hydroxy-tetrahydrodipicolinate synthase [Lysobacteraceae bacterium NML91-0268]|nr:4-hydroxy-tetrahydrodipicolinate synthase [Xanthomonadaceae bacterium NML91-0268]
MTELAHRLQGSITALITPFDKAGALDMPAWQRLIAAQLEGGTQALVVAGSTGEAAALGDDEYQSLLRAAVRQVAGRVPVLAGSGLANTAKTIALTRIAADCGADAALVVTPPYVRPTQAGLLAHYQAVADAGGLPVVLYNVPGRTGCDMQPQTVAALAAHSRIIGIKEAVADAERMAALVALKNPGFVVLSGDDPTACRAMLCGADGVVSVASNALPRAMQRLCDLARNAEDTAAKAWDARLQPVFEFLGCEPNPVPIKAILQRMGIGEGLRLPLMPLSAAHQEWLQATVAAILSIENQAG